MELTEQQREAVSVSDRNVVVSAGAGTGKTAVLVARFVNLVRSGLAEVNQVLTITFTEKAADEMKRRIAAEFRRLKMRKEETASPTRAGARIGTDACATVETSYISTIHSFCSRLIRENPFVAGVDPQYEVMNDIDRQLMLGELFDELFREGGEDFLELAEQYGERAIGGAIISYMDLCRSLGRGVEYVEELLAEPEILTRKAQLAAEKRAAAALPEIRENVRALSELEATGSYERRRQEVVAVADLLADAARLREAAEALASATARMPALPKKESSRTACLAVREQLSRIRRILKQEEAAIFFDKDAEAILLPSKTALLTGVALFWRKYEQRKKERGVLDYEDLQLIARGLLKDNQTLRREYAERFRYVLVDEFQDINWLQKELIDLLTSRQNLFVVGDSCQSIYGFRNADVEIFADLIEKCVSSSRTHHAVCLNENFRSGQNLIHFLNFFFCRLWEKGGLPGYQRGAFSSEQRLSGSRRSRQFRRHSSCRRTVDLCTAPPAKLSYFRPLQFARKHGEEPAMPSVEIMLALADAVSERSKPRDAATDAAGDSAPALGSEGLEETRRREARAVTGRIVRAVENEEMTVYDPAIEKSRPVAYGDVAILCRTRASYAAYAEALTEHGVPFCVVGGQSFYDRQEVADMINLLRVIDNPLRDIPFVAVLRSPFVGVKGDTLLLLRQRVAGRLNSPCVMAALRETDSISGIADDEKERLKRFLDLLDKLRATKDSMPVHLLVKAALDSTTYLTRALATSEGMQKAGNVRKFLDILTEYESRERGGIGGFLRFYEVMRSYGPQEEEAALEPFSGDAVKLMTIHAAKGLEFPVVVVADMARRFNFDTGKFLVSREMEIGCGPSQESSASCCGRRLVFDERKEKQIAEEKRLFYVAMTRAKEHLILAGSCRRERQCDIDEASSPMDWLLAIVGREVDLPEPGNSWEAQLGQARVKISVDAGGEVGTVMIAERSPSERYLDRIKSGEKLPVPDGVEGLLPEVRKTLQRIGSRRAEPLSPPAKTSVSQLMLFEECSYKFLLQEVLKFPDREVMKSLGLWSGERTEAEKDFLDVSGKPRLGVGGRQFGELVHACLEQIDLRGEKTQNLQPVISRFFASSEQMHAAEELIRRFLASEEAERLRSARELYREIEVKAALNDVIITGVIDVLFLDDENRWTILDFKTGSLQPEEQSQRHLYDFQMLLYAYLVSEAVGARPEKAMIYFLASGVSRFVSTGTTEIERTRNRVSEVLTAISRGEFARNTTRDCRQCEYIAICRPQNAGAR